MSSLPNEEQSEALSHAAMEVMKHAVRIKPMNANLGDILKAAQADNHYMWRPTDIVYKDEEIVGGLELASTSLVLLWMHSKKTNIRDSVAVANYFENVMARFNQPNFILPVAEKSPYMAYVKQMGYIDLGKFNLFLKKA